MSIIAERQGLEEQGEAGFTGQQLPGIPISPDFLQFHHFWLEKEASDMMLAAITGYADALWSLSTWYLTILEDREYGVNGENSF
jgi:hypothetical protein